MKKHVLIMFSILLVLSLFTGCRQMTAVLPATEPTKPAPTAKPSLPETEPSETMQEDTISPVHTIPPEDGPDATIEDGNGPIPSQETR